MVDVWSAMVMGLFTGIGVESAKVVHELFIEKRLRKVSEGLKGVRFEFRPPRF